MKKECVLDFVKSEMKLSLGCTEPVAVGLAVSNTCHMLNGVDHLKVKMSSNIFKNAYSVKIPGAGEHGIELACALGVLCAKADNTMEIFSQVNPEMVVKAKEMLKRGVVELEVQPDSRFYIEIWADKDGVASHSITLNGHDNLILLEVDGKVLVDKQVAEEAEEGGFDIVGCKLSELVDFAATVPFEDIKFLREAVETNNAASAEGLSDDYGLRVGKKLDKMMKSGELETNLFFYVKRKVAAACDMRMAGGPKAAMTVLGSGNQGFEATLPSIATCEYLGLPEEKMLRAILMSVLITAFMKYQVGRLSPICGATLSGAASSGAITWLMGGNHAQIAGAIQNVFGNLSGMICDGAKDGCALKLSTCAGEAVMSAQLALDGSIITDSDGLIGATMEDTVRYIASLSLNGMAAVDMNLINTMLSKSKAAVA